MSFVFILFFVLLIVFSFCATRIRTQKLKQQRPDVMNAGYRGMNPAKGGMETMTRGELAAMLIVCKSWKSTGPEFNLSFADLSNARNSQSKQ
jgi:hypothetical protein